MTAPMRSLKKIGRKQMPDPFQDKHRSDRAKAIADQQQAAKDALAAHRKKKFEDAKRPKDPNDDLGYGYKNKGDGWPWPKVK